MSFGASILYVSSPYPGFHCRRVVDVVDVHLPTDFLQKAIHSTKELRTADSDKQTPQENPTKSSSYGNRSKKNTWHPNGTRSHSAGATAGYFPR